MAHWVSKTPKLVNSQTSQNTPISLKKHTAPTCVPSAPVYGLVFNAVFVLKTHYPSGRAWVRFLVRLVMRLDELSLEICLERRTTKGSSSGRIKRLVPVFILETHNQTNYKMFAQVRPDG